MFYSKLYFGECCPHIFYKLFLHHYHLCNINKITNNKIHKFLIAYFEIVLWVDHFRNNGEFCVVKFKLESKFFEFPEIVHPLTTKSKPIGKENHADTRQDMTQPPLLFFFFCVDPIKRE